MTKIFNQGKKRLVADWPLIPNCETTAEVKRHQAAQVRYTSEPNRTVSVPDDLAAFWIEKFPTTFITDEEAKKQAALNVEQLSQKDKEIADLKSEIEKMTKLLEEAQALMLEQATKAKVKVRAPGRQEVLV
jgi:hypothetical protein